MTGPLFSDVSRHILGKRYPTFQDNQLPSDTVSYHRITDLSNPAAET